MNAARHPHHAVRAGRPARPGARRNAAFGVVVAAAGVGLAVGYLRLPMRMMTVQVSGLTRLSREEVVRMIGLEPGTLMGSAETRQLAQNLARRPQFASVAVSRGLTGVLHVKVAEREPVAWSVRTGCAVAADGVLLPALSVNRDAWIGLDGLAIAQGRMTDARLVAEALALFRGLKAGGAPRGVLRGVPGGGWEWQVDGKRIALSSPLQPAELERLWRFQRSFPDAWARARVLDLRYDARVVVSAGAAPAAVRSGAGGRGPSARTARAARSVR